MHLSTEMEQQIAGAIIKYNGGLGTMTGTALLALVTKLCQEYYRESLPNVDFGRRLAEQLKDFSQQKGLRDWEAARVRSEVLMVRLR